MKGMCRGSWSWGVMAGLLLIGATVLAADDPKKPAARQTTSPSLRPITEDPALPRVLLIGDSISMGYTLPTRALLAGQANVCRAPDNCGPTSKGLEKLDAWLGTGPWDVIHFNFGLHDLKHVDGKAQVSLEQYEKNLRQIVARLEKTGAVLVWATTTPVPEGLEPSRTPADVVAYNAAAVKIMKEHRIAVDDLYACVLPIEKEVQIPANVHFHAAGSQAMAKQVAASIVEALATRAKK